LVESEQKVAELQAAKQKADLEIADLKKRLDAETDSKNKSEGISYSQHRFK